MNRRSFLAAWVLAALSIPQVAHAIVFQNAAAQTAGLGAGQVFLDAEAALVISLSNSTKVGCSGSLLAGGAYVLTAAHCVTGDTGTLTANSISLNFANVGLQITATSYIVDPVWNGSVTNGGDLALIKLNAPVTSIAGYTLDTASSVVGDVIMLVGYGNTGVGSSGYVNGTFGTLYYGANQYAETYVQVPSVYAYVFEQYNPPGVGMDEAMIAPGDSGGASLLYTDGSWQIVGVHDFIACDQLGCTPNSSFGQLGGDTSVYADQTWLDKVLAPEPGSAPTMIVGLLGLAGMVWRDGQRTGRRQSITSR